MGFSQVSNWEGPDLVSCPKEQRCPQRTATSVYWEFWAGILISARGPFLGNLWRGLLWGCTVGEKAVRCCRSHGSTVRVVSMLATLLRSFALHRVSAEQQVTELPPVCQARSLFASPLEKLSLMGGAGRAPRG